MKALLSKILVPGLFALSACAPKLIQPRGVAPKNDTKSGPLSQDQTMVKRKAREGQQDAKGPRPQLRADVLEADVPEEKRVGLFGSNGNPTLKALYDCLQANPNNCFDLTTNGVLEMQSYAEIRQAQMKAADHKLSKEEGRQILAAALNIQASHFDAISRDFQRAYEVKAKKYSQTIKIEGADEALHSILRQDYNPNVVKNVLGWSFEENHPNVTFIFNINVPNLNVSLAPNVHADETPVTEHSSGSIAMYRYNAYTAVIEHLIATRKVLGEKEWRKQNYVVVTAPGHLLTGYMAPIPNPDTKAPIKYRLIGIENTVRGLGVVDFGPADKLPTEIRVVDADLFLQLDVFKLLVENISSYADACIDATAVKYNIAPEAIHWTDATDFVLPDYEGRLPDTLRARFAYFQTKTPFGKNDRVFIGPENTNEDLYAVTDYMTTGQFLEWIKQSKNLLIPAPPETHGT